MYKVITIGDKDYKVEYTIEASMYKDFVEKLTKFTMNYGGLVARYDIKGEEVKTKDKLIDYGIDAISDLMVMTTTQVPELARLGFYAGLMEHHRDITKEKAFELYKQYITEWRKKPIDVIADMMAKVEEDNFFDLIGLDLKMIAKNSKPTQQKKGKKKVIEKQ